MVQSETEEPMLIESVLNRGTSAAGVYNKFPRTLLKCDGDGLYYNVFIEPAFAVIQQDNQIRRLIKRSPY